jgi:conjugative transposon TraM protein
MKEATMRMNDVKFQREQKMLMVMPVLVIPFLTLLFWVMGGGRGIAAETPASGKAGLNTELPKAHLKDDKNWNKLDFYEQAAEDSARYLEQQSKDPYYSRVDDSILPERKLAYDPYPGEPAVGKDPNEEKVYKKLAQLNQELEKAANKPAAADSPVAPVSPAIDSRDIDRLENMMQMMNSQEGSGDPEMKQIDGMLDKIMAIQHPEKVKEQLRSESKKNATKVYPVETVQEHAQVSRLGKAEQHALSDSLRHRSRFYSVSSSSDRLAEAPNAISATISETQSLVNGAVVKLRLTQDVYVQGRLIPTGKFIYGTATLAGERLNIAIQSMKIDNAILPVKLEVFDMDGLPGIYVPGAINRDVVKQSADETIQGIGLNTLDASLGIQAAGAAIEAGKSILSRKVRLVRVTVKADYQVLLKDGRSAE